MTLHGTQEQEHGQPAKAAQPSVPQPAPVETPPGQEGTPEIKEEQQYSGKEVRTILSADGRTQKDRADKAEGEVTRLTGIVTDQTTKLETVSGQIAQLLKAKDDADVEKVGEDPTAIASLRARQANRTETLRLEGVEATQKAREVKFVERETAVEQAETSVSIKLAAMAAGVDEKALAARVPDGDPTRLSLVVNDLKTGGGQVEIDPVTKQPVPPGLKNIPASPVSAGGDSRGVAEVMLEKAKTK